MGARGKAPSPTALLLLKGSKRAKYQKRSEPQPVLCIPEKPRHIAEDEEASAHWDEIAPRLYRDGVLADSDKHSLATMCEQYSLMRRAWKAIQPPKIDPETGQNIGGMGDFIKDPADPSGRRRIPNPYRKLYENAELRYTFLDIQFGGTPSARSRVVANRPDEKKNEWEVFGTSKKA